MEEVLQNNIHQNNLLKSPTKMSKKKTRKKRKPNVFLTDREYKASKRNTGEQCKFEAYCKRLEQEEQIQDRDNQQTMTILCSKDAERRRRLGHSYRKPKSEQCTINVECCEGSFKMSRDNRNKLSSPTLTCCGICKGTQSTVHRYEAQKLQLESLTTGYAKGEATSICLFYSDKDLEVFMELLEQEMEKLGELRRELQTGRFSGTNHNVSDNMTSEAGVDDDEDAEHTIRTSDSDENFLNKVSNTSKDPFKRPKRIRPQSSPLKSVASAPSRPNDLLQNDLHLFHHTRKDFIPDKSMQSPHSILSTALGNDDAANDKSLSMIKEAMQCLDLNKNDSVRSKIINNLRQKGYINLEQLT